MEITHYIIWNGKGCLPSETPEASALEKAGRKRGTKKAVTSWVGGVFTYTDFH